MVKNAGAYVQSWYDIASFSKWDKVYSYSNSEAIPLDIQKDFLKCTFSQKFYLVYKLRV